MGRTFACSDLHGNGKLWAEIKKFLNEDDILYYLGDATDRGPDGWAILKEMLVDKRIIYIAGNHDIMLANRIARPNSYDDAILHHCNGGSLTWDDAEKDPEADTIKSKIRNLPLYKIYQNKDGLKIFMSHSGSTNIEDADALIWDRDEYITQQNHTEYDVIVHGHTTIPHLIKDLEKCYNFYNLDGVIKPRLAEWEGGAYWYHGFRCDIDCYTVGTDQTVLLNLDTFDEEIFEL